MFNTFGDLLAFGLFAPLILRVVVGCIFIAFGYVKADQTKNDTLIQFDWLTRKNLKIITSIIALIEVVGGIFLVVGLYTQISAIALAIISLGAIVLKFKHRGMIKNTEIFYLLLFAICISLVFSGAGFYAFDLPI